MIRTLLLASVACISIAHPASAQVLTEDIEAVKQLYLEYAVDLKAAAADLKLVATSAQQLQWAINQYNSFVAYPSLATAMGLLNAIGLRNPLPFSPYAIQGVISGQGGAVGLQSITSKLSQLSSFASQSVGQNHVYTCTAGTWQCQQQIAGAYGIGGQQGIAQNLLSQMADHVPVIASLRQDLLNASTPAERESAMGQLQSESAWMQQTTVQMQAAGSLAAIERDNRLQREQEHLTGCIEAQLAAAQARGVITGMTLAGGGCVNANAPAGNQTTAAAAGNPDLPVPPIPPGT